MPKYNVQSDSRTLTAGASAVAVLEQDDVAVPGTPTSAVWAMPVVATLKLTNSSALLPATVTVSLQARADDGSWTEVESQSISLGLASGLTGTQRATIASAAACEPSNTFSARLMLSCTGANVTADSQWLLTDPSVPL